MLCVGTYDTRATDVKSRELTENEGTEKTFFMQHFACTCHECGTKGSPQLSYLGEESVSRYIEMVKTSCEINE